MDESSRNRITELLDVVGAGDHATSEELLQLLYQDLRKLAQSRMAKLPPGDTLQPTALIHETYMRLVERSPDAWDGKAHFFGAASQAMWWILVERAREKSRIKRGGRWQRTALTTNLDLAELSADDKALDFLALDQALEKLGKDTRRGKVVFLRFVAGFSVEEAAEALGVTSRTVERDWHFARLFLLNELAADTDTNTE